MNKLNFSNSRKQSQKITADENFFYESDEEMKYQSSNIHEKISPKNEQMEDST